VDAWCGVTVPQRFVPIYQPEADGFTVVSHPRSCAVCSGSTHPQVLLFFVPVCDDEDDNDTQELIVCPHCADAWRLLELIRTLLEGK
jgi:hypothetical protein